MSTTTKERPKAAEDTKAASPTAGNWSRIDARCKPSKVLSKDGMRPVLTCGHIRHEPEHGSFLFATDSYMLVAIPITMDPDIPAGDRASFLPEVAIPPEGLRQLDNSSRGEFRIVDGLFEVSGNPALFRVNAGLEPPNFRILLDDAPAVKGKGAEIDRIGFNPSLLKALAEAMGAGNGGIAFEFRDKLKSMRVEPLNHSGAEGLLMPIRLDV